MKQKRVLKVLAGLLFVVFVFGCSDTPDGTAKDVSGSRDYLRMY